MGEVEANLGHIKGRIEEACRRAGRDPAEVEVVGVTKTVGPERISEAAAAGLRVFGENRVQEAEAKIAKVVVADCEWHLIGHLQTNKARPAARLFQLIETIDTMRLAETLNRLAAKAGSPIRALIEINTSGEPAKHGFHPTEIGRHFGRILELPWLRIEGFMTVGPLDGPEATRRCFRELRRLRDDFSCAEPRASLHTLSMGMTDDFEIAIEEGSTMIRLGRAIFGVRQ